MGLRGIYFKVVKKGMKVTKQAFTFFCVVS